MNWIPAQVVDAMAPTTGWAGSDDELLAMLRRFQDIGTDEVHLVPTSSNIDQLRRVAELAKQFAYRCRYRRVTGPARRPGIAVRRPIKPPILVEACPPHGVAHETDCAFVDNQSIGLTVIRGTVKWVKVLKA